MVGRSRAGSSPAGLRRCWGRRARRFSCFPWGRPCSRAPLSPTGRPRRRLPCLCRGPAGWRCWRSCARGASEAPSEGDVPLGAILGAGNFNELAGGYVGLIALALAGLALAVAGLRGIDRFLAILGGVAFAVAYRIPPVANLGDALPLFRVTANSRALLVLAFALAMLAGRGAHLLLSAPASVVRPIVRRAEKLLVGVAIGVAILTALLLPMLETQRGRIMEMARSRLLARPPVTAPDRHLHRLPEYVDRVERLGLREGARAAVLLVLAALVLEAGWGARRRPLVAVLLPALVGLDLFMLGRDYNPAIPPALAYPPTPALEFLQESARTLPRAGARRGAASQHEPHVRTERAAGLQCGRDAGLPTLSERHRTVLPAAAEFPDAVLLQLCVATRRSGQCPLRAQ